jgi:hypothetical protein
VVPGFELRFGLRGFSVWVCFYFDALESKDFRFGFAVALSFFKFHLSVILEQSNYSLLSFRI